MSGRAGHGLFPNEARIMDLHDAGLSMDAIVKRTGLAPGFVLRTVRTFREGAQESAWEQSVRLSSAALVRACAATGQRFA